MLQALRTYDDCVNPVGQTPLQELWLYCVKVVMSLLRAGIPLSKLDI